MPRVCTICTHPEREAINLALFGEDSLRDIAERYGTSKTALQRHKADHIPAALAKAQQAQAEAEAINVLDELKQMAERVRLLYDACDRWLRDPDDAQRYTLDARASEVTVIYDEQHSPDEKPKRKRATLSTLLDRIEDKLGVTVVMTERRMADPRELILKTYDRLQGQLELIAKLIGQLDDRPQVNILLAPEWQQLRSMMLDALAAYPEARIAIADALLAAEANDTSTLYRN